MTTERQCRLGRHAVQVDGAGTETIIFGNGFGTGRNAWRHQVAAFRDEYRLIRFDYIGMPDSDLSAYDPGRYDSLFSHADDLVALLEELEVEGATLVGHSVSAMIGALAAIAAPERIARLVFIGGSPRYIDGDGYRGGFSHEEIEASLAAMASDYHAWVSGFSPQVVGNPHRPQATEEFASYLRRMRPDIAHMILSVVFRSDLRSVLPRVRQPTMVIQPRADVAVPVEVGRYIASRVPLAVLREIEATGHIPHVTAPDQVTPLIREHLAA